MLGQWLFGMLLAVFFPPYGWVGKTQVVNVHVPLAIFLGGSLTTLPVYLAFRHPTQPRTRHVIAAAQMLWSALLIHLSGGRVETHFQIFGSLAFLAFYRDWQVLVTATAVVAAEHLLRGTFCPNRSTGSSTLNGGASSNTPLGCCSAMPSRCWRASAGCGRCASLPNRARTWRRSRTPPGPSHRRSPGRHRERRAGAVEQVSRCWEPNQYRFDEVRLLSSPTHWTTLTPGEFHKLPLADRIQLLVAWKLRFLCRGVEISPVEALKD